MIKPHRKLTLKCQTLRALAPSQTPAAQGGAAWSVVCSVLQLCPSPTVGCPRTTTL
jgi:hypothetical protein